MANPIVIGRFELSAEDVVSGPGDYMIDQGNAKIDKIMSGDDAGFNVMLQVAPQPVDIRRMVLIALQTDYAGWKGMQQVHSWLGGKRPAGCKSRI